MSTLYDEVYVKSLLNRIEELENQLDDMRLQTHVLLDIARSLNASLDVKVIAQNTISAIAALIALDKATICLYDEREKEFDVIGVFDASTIYPELPKDFDPELLHSILMSGKTYYQKPNDNSVKLVCSLPLQDSQRKIGLINIHSLRDSEITQDQMEFLETLASHTSSALGNALLYAIVEKESITDSLTGIYNHRYLKKRLREEIALCQRGKRHNALGIIMIDIDYFKSFNDTYGHQFGDKVLIEVVKSLTDNLREEDIFARYGGEEFVLLIPQATEKMLIIVSEKIRKVVENTKVYHNETGRYVYITVSVGATLWKPTDTPESMLHRADTALYNAKSKGRNQIVLV